MATRDLAKSSMKGVEFITSTGEHCDLLLVSLPNAPYILGRDSSLPLENLSIARLAADAAGYGLQVGICDGDELGLSLEALQDIVLSCACRVVGLTSYQSNIVESLQLLEEYKRKYPSATTCMGGYQVTFTAEELLTNEPYLDSVIVGRGERVLPRLVLTAKCGGFPRGIFGNSRPNDLIPLPPSEDVHGQRADHWMARYLPAVRQRRAAALISSEGCISNCSFCATPMFERLETGFPWKPRAPEDVVNEILQLQSAADVTSIHFHDPDFLGLTPSAWERARRIAELLKHAGFNGSIRFTAQARAAAALPMEFWSLWKSVGLERVFIGFESGADSVLAQYRKSSKVRDNVEASRKLRAASIAIQCGFIMFTPDLVPDDVMANLEFLASVEQDHLGRSYTNELKIYPGTRDFETYKGRGLLTYSKSYLPLGVRYVDPKVSALRESLGNLAFAVFPMDMFLRDLEFALIAENPTILTEFGLLDNCEILRKLYDRLRRDRSQAWQSSFHRALTVKPAEIGDVMSALRLFESGLWRTVLESVPQLPRATVGAERAALEVS